MKRRISILLSLILLLSSSGLTLGKHYCNGELVNVFLLPHFGECCDASMPMEDDSCENEFMGFLLDNPVELISPKIVITHSVQWVQLAETFLLIYNNVLSSKNLEIVLSSPPLSNIKIYLRVESFLN